MVVVMPWLHEALLPPSQDSMARMSVLHLLPHGLSVLPASCTCLGWELPVQPDTWPVALERMAVNIQNPLLPRLPLIKSMSFSGLRQADEAALQVQPLVLFFADHC